MRFRIGIAAAVALITLLSFGLFKCFDGTNPKRSNSGTPEVLTWERLGMLDYRTGNAPEWLESLSGQLVRVAGFVVPLEDNYQSVSEFLLVPDPGSCVHVPPPPPNQMVYVRMNSGERVRLQGFPIWTTGTLKIENVKSPYGPVAYSIEGHSTQPFKGWSEF